MLLHPVCEPIDLPPGTVARIDFVTSAAGAPPAKRFLHFHDVVEVVLFGQARGHFVCDGARFAVLPGSIFYAPTMRYHDYVADDGATDWVLIQIDPYVVERIAVRTGLAPPAAGFCVAGDAATNDRLTILGRWLGEACADGGDVSLAEHVVTLLLAVVWRVPRSDGVRVAGLTTDIERFTPVIDQLRAFPGAPLPLRKAASLCNLSPAYFSRRFSEIFGCGFADYVAAYRLHLAARHVASTRTPFSMIGYQLGFASPSHFSARYKERFGMTPRAYRLAMQRRGASQFGQRS